MGRDQVIIHVVWMRCCETNTLQPVDFCKVTDQPRKPTIMAMIGVHVLTEQRDFPHATFHQIPRLAHHPVCWTRDLGATRVGHDTKRTKFVAALLHRQKCGRPALGFWTARQMLELVFLREIRVKRTSTLTSLRLKFRQAMVGLRANNQVDHRLTRDNLGTLSLRNTACYADFQIRLGIFQRAVATKLRIYLFRRLFADVARVQKDHIRVFGSIRRHIALTAKTLRHPLAVVDVHLTAIGFDKKLLRRGHLAQLPR